MATQGQVKLAGRFPPGTKVALVQVRDETALRAEGGKTVERKRVKDDGTVTFKAEVGARYFLTGQVNGRPLEVRVTGRKTEASDGSVPEQAPVQPDRVKLSDGSWADETPEKRDTPSSEVGPYPGQDQVPARTPQRSSTPRGSAHPVEKDEQAPYPPQEESKGPQMSDTETGQATPIVDAPQRQDQVPASVPQRSATPLGVATPIPGGNAIEAQREKESAHGKAARGEPGKVAASPLDADVASKRQKTAAEKVNADVESDSDGLDAQGQPASEDIAAAAGTEPASKPSEPIRRSKTSSTTAKNKEKK